jgi:hypothetical protein
MRRQILLGFFILSAATAAPLRALSAETPPAPLNAVEAESIRVTLYGNNGQAFIDGCDQCPIRAQVDSETRFFLRAEEISRSQAPRLSGNGGGAVYSAGRIVKIIWVSGSLD